MLILYWQIGVVLVSTFKINLGYESGRSLYSSEKHTILNINANIIIRSLLTFVGFKTQKINSTALQFAV